MKIKNQKGQSTIEFIMTFTVTIGFIFLFLQMALNYTSGYLIHHATFMASRAFLASDSEQKDSKVGEDNAEIFAQKVFLHYMPQFMKPDMSKFHVNRVSMEKRAFVGVYYDFTQIFSLSFIGGKDEMYFRSESFLGREPTRPENNSQICKRMKSVIGSTTCEFHMTLDDNGG
jgi:hypothetical protein